MPFLDQHMLAVLKGEARERSVGHGRRADHDGVGLDGSESGWQVAEQRRVGKLQPGLRGGEKIAVDVDQRHRLELRIRAHNLDRPGAAPAHADMDGSQDHVRIPSGK